MIAWVKWRENIMSYIPKSYLASTRRCHQTRSSVVFDENQKITERLQTLITDHIWKMKYVCVCLSQLLVIM